MTFWILIALAIAMVAYVRLAPSDQNRWHRQAPHKGQGEKRLKGGYIWREQVQGDGRDRLQAIDRAATADPATRRLCGSVEEGQITYVSRSKWIGFPDYTTVTVYEDAEGEAPGTYLEIYSRLRFGRSDFGVNAKRVRQWLRTVERG